MLYNSYTITRLVDDYILNSVMNIREEYFYETTYNERYWAGGIYSLLSKEEIKKSHENDVSSKFLLLFDNCKKLVGYSRYSLNFEMKDYAKLHIFICKKELLGKEITVIENEKGIIVKAGKFMLEKVIEDCKKNNCKQLVSEICVFPYPNLPSLILHKNFGFVSMSDKLISMQVGDCDVQFLELTKELK